MSKEVKVGVGVIVHRDGKILLGKRKGGHGAGQYAPPGGRLHFMETFEDCAVREVGEETGIVLKGRIDYVGVSNNMYPDEEHHYVSLLMESHYNEGDPVLVEPDKCEGWDWYDPKNLPEPLFQPFKDFASKLF